MQCEPARWATSNINFAFDVTAGKKFHQNWYCQHLIYSKFCYSQSAADFIQELTRTPSCKGWSGGMSNVGRFVYKSFDIYLRWIVEVGGEIAPGWFFVLQQCVFIPSHLHRMQKMRHFRATRRQWNVEPLILELKRTARFYQASQIGYYSSCYMARKKMLLFAVWNKSFTQDPKGLSEHRIH